MRANRYLFLVLLLLLVALCQAQPTVTPVAPGVTLTCERIPEAPWEIRALRIDRQCPTLSFDLALGMGKLRGVETLTNTLVREMPQGAPIVAAVNADFFVMAPAPDAGIVCGLAVRRGELVMTARGRPAFALRRDGSPLIGVFDTAATLTSPNGEVAVGGLNQPQVKDGVCAFTSIFGWPQTECVVVKLDGLPLTPNGTWEGRVTEIVSGQASREAREGEVLLRADGAALPALDSLRPGDPIRLSLRSPNLTGDVSMAAGGSTILMQGGKVAVTPGANDPRHPRTAVGFNEREIILVTVDGRQAGWSVGMTLPELALLMQRLGCTDALNLDGGGSTTCWAGGKVVNRPSGGAERQIADEILVRSSAGPTPQPPP